MTMVNSLSNYLEQKFIEAELKNTSFAGVATVYLGLFTVAAGETGGGTEVSGGSYARQALTSASAWSAGAQVGGAYEVQNAADIAFPAATADWGEVVAMATYDAITAGNEYRRIWLTTLAYEFSALNAGDVFTAPGHTLVNGNRVILQGATLPTGVSEDTIYFVVGVSGSTFQLSLTSGGAAIVLTADGTGLVNLIVPKTINNTDQFKVLAGNLKLSIA